jgi:hypothetical protein
LSCLFGDSFVLPETKGRSFDELDVLFAKKVSARKFKSTVVDTFDESETAGIVGNARGNEPAIHMSVDYRAFSE